MALLQADLLYFMQKMGGRYSWLEMRQEGNDRVMGHCRICTEHRDRLQVPKAKQNPGWAHAYSVVLRDSMNATEEAERMFINRARKHQIEASHKGVKKLSEA